MDLIESIKANAKKNLQRIVLAEGTEERTIKAADQAIAEGIADIILLGNKAKIDELAQNFGLKNISKATVIDPENNPRADEYAKLLFELRQAKGMTMEEAQKLVKNPLYLGCLIIKNGDADGEVAGAMNATSNVLRPALQIIKMKKGISVVSGAFLLLTGKEEFGEKGMFLFADCAVTPNPTAQQLAEIAVVSASTAKTLGGFEPRVAMLSFSTKGSAKNECVDKVQEATKIAKEMAPELTLDGEFQADAAIVPSVGKQKAPGSCIQGDANVLVFPTLDAGNIGYKLAQRMSGGVALGPILQGMAASVNDLSRGCTPDEIVKMIAITANQAMK
ncbi:MAG: phosphate acetyltransferase [Paludibacteraceae bacterium]|nr:phosphate acetyltransferase [Paludibacteraceae bacterium]